MQGQFLKSLDIEPIHGVSGREHVMGKKKKKKFLDPSGLSSPQLEIKMIMSLTCKVPIFYIIVIFNNNYLVIIQTAFPLKFNELY